MAVDLRKFTRFPVRFQSSFRSSYLVAGEGVIVDLSLGGCRVSCSTPVPSGTQMEMRVHLPDQESPVQIDSVGVRWAQEGGFGVEFLQMQPEAQERLRVFVTSLGTPAGY